MRTLKSSRQRAGIGLAAVATVAVTGAVLTFTPASETVAAFADREFGIGVFSATSLNMQGNATADVTAGSSGWTDHFTGANPAVFQPVVGTVIPGGATRSYSRFGLRLAAGSTNNVTVTVAAGEPVTPPEQAALFSMRLVRTASSTCDLTTFGAGTDPKFLVGSATTFGTMLTAPAGQFTLPSSGVPTYLCYEFSLPNATPPAGLTNGATTTVGWTVTAESIV